MIKAQIRVSTSSSVKSRFMLPKRFLRISEISTVGLLALYIFVVMFGDHMFVERVLLELGCIFTVLLGALQFRLLFDVPADRVLFS